MDLPDLKIIQKVAAACRKAGVKVYECSDFKITLSDFAPPASAYKQRKAAKAGKPLPNKDFIQGSHIPTDMPSEEELLFAAVGGPPPEWNSQ